MSLISTIKRVVKNPSLALNKSVEPIKLAGWREYQGKYDAARSDLRKHFTGFCVVENEAKRNRVRELIAQEGTIDARIEGLEGKEFQRDLTVKFHWGHNHDFGNGLSIAGRMGDRHINLMAEFMTGFDLPRDFLQGKSCIDVGSWTGGTTLMLKSLGAGRVLALEEVKKYANTAKALCQEIYGFEDVASDGTNLYELTVNDDRYDVAYFAGVIYHLSDPVLGLRRLFNSLVDGGICLVETAGINDERSIAQFDGNRIYHNADVETSAKLNRGGWNWFLPSPLCLERWMIEAGFENVRTYYSHSSDRVFGYGERTKYTDICRAGLSVPDVE